MGIADQLASAASAAGLTQAPAKVAPSASPQQMSKLASTALGNGVPAQSDLFFRFTAVNPSAFNKDYGYEMRIVDMKSQNVVAQYIFPLNPTSISMTTNPSTTLEATMQGIYENHNGAVFRPISISGTTGINVIPSAVPSSGSGAYSLQSTLNYAFQNTIQSVNTVANQLQKTFNAFSGGTQASTGPINYAGDDATIGNLTTGYQTIHDLKRFLDFYLASKKSATNKSWRLYFLMYKDQEYYACSLGPYSITKGAGTTEYQYNIQLTAYRRDATIPTGRVAKGTKSAINAKSTANVLSNILNGLQQARTLVSAANNVMSGIRSDIQNSFIAPLGQIILLAKDLQGLATNMSDFAFSGSTIKSMESNFTQYFTDNSSLQTSVAQAIGSPAGPAINNPSLTVAKTGTGQPQSVIYGSAQNKLSNGLAEQFQPPSQSADPLEALFANPANYPQVFAQFPIEDMNLSSSINDQLTAITNTVRQFTANDLITRRNQITNFSASISAALGGASATYNAFYGLPPPPVNYNSLTVDAINLLSALNDIAIYTDKFIAMMDQAEANSNQDYYQWYSDYAVAQGLQFNTNNISRFFVPFPYGATLEQLATQYLGSPDNWIQIASLNALKAPYVDEIGYAVPVTASSGGNTLTVAASQYIYIGQVVSVSSNTVAPVKYKVASIDLVDATTTIITFVNNPGFPLTAYRPSEGASIQAFMPNTINSSMLIAIPSPSVPTYPTTFKTSPDIDQLNSLYQMAKVDFQLSPSGDLILTGGGDVQMAFGLTNLVQAALLKIYTNTQTMLQLPQYGNPVEAGTNIADTSASDILKALNLAFQDDPRFTGITAGTVQITGPVVSIQIMVGLQDVNVSLPVAAQLPR